jgi:uncharacterized protein
VAPTEEARFVLDTNVLISASLFPRSVPGLAFALARSRGQVLTSQAMVEELRDVLARTKFDRYLSRDLRDEFLVGFIAAAEFVQVLEQVSVCRDPKDNRVLEAAVNGRATCIVSGDDDLLTMQVFQDIPIFTPASFLAYVERTGA